MKLSLAWIFDHIDVPSGSWTQFDVAMIARRFNEVTAEIEHVEKRSLDLANFFLVARQAEGWLVDEVNTVVDLEKREASNFVYENTPETAFLVKKIGQSYVWATLRDFGVDSDSPLPAVHAPDSVRNGLWRNFFETVDFIIEVDNKSVTHRPDMWGHRGFAREIAPFVGKKLRAATDFLIETSVEQFTDAAQSSSKNSSFIIKNQEPSLCKAFNGLLFTSIDNRPCDLKIMARLLAVGSRPHSALVDLTNYLVHDWGQPVHAYDAAKIEDKTVVVRRADKGEELLLLDGNTIKLETEDLVIADSRKPICLAGVKGGMNDSITKDTKAVFLESANFDPGCVRRSGLRHKTRTDASARFEKTLDPNLALEAIHRFVFLAKEAGVNFQAEDVIISLGKQVEKKKINLEHSFLEKRMGISLDSAHIKKLLTELEFEVTFDNAQQQYTVVVPTWRSSKDIETKEDILEEVVRTYGFANIPLIMPTITRRPFSLVPVMRHRLIKRYLAQAMHLVEMQNYAFYDEGFIRSIELEMSSPVELLNPVSENYRRLITSLIPGLLKNVSENQLHHESLGFFESGRVWHEVNGEVTERKALAICTIVKRSVADFYEAKSNIASLFESLGIAKDLISWEQIAQPVASWYKPYQTAAISLGDKHLGVIGKANPLFLGKLGMQEEVDAIFIELDLEAILALEVPVKRFVPLPRYQETYLDFSFMVPLSLQTVTLEQTLKDVSPLVSRVELRDFFEKESWDNQRSLTFRMWVLDHEGTIDKARLDTLWQEAVQKTDKLGAILRAA